MEKQTIQILEKAIRVAAEDAYQNEVIDTHTEELDVGEGKVFRDKEDWIAVKIAEWVKVAAK